MSLSENDSNVLMFMYAYTFLINLLLRKSIGFRLIAEAALRYNGVDALTGTTVTCLEVHLPRM